MKCNLSFSGGKDSTALLLVLIRLGWRIDEVVFFDTGWEFPQMYRHIELVKNLCISHGIKFTTLRPETNFDYLMFDKPVKEKGGGTHNGYSWCGARCVRWGTTEKTKSLDAYNAEAITYIGIAADETERLEKERAENKRFPLAELGITERQCLEICYAAGYRWEGLYELLDRVSCKCCAAKNLKELRNMYFKMPEVWQDLRERQKKTNRPFKGPGQSVFQLEKRFELEKLWEAEGLNTRGKAFYQKLKEITAEGETE